MATISWAARSHAESLGCLIEPDRVADVGSQAVGVLEQLHVERGDQVAAGQIVARLAAQVERASVSVAEAKSRAEAEARQAQAAFELAQRKLERTKDLVKRDFLSDQALDQSEAESRVAQQRIEQAREAQRVAQREYKLSTAQLSQREVRSPFAGLVIERYRTEGERIEREPVIRVARVDPLRIEAIVPAAQFGTIVAGQSATIKTDLGSFSAMTATVSLVDRVIDPASNSFRVRLVLPNPGNRIPAGLRCRVSFGASEGPGQAPGGAATAPNAVNKPAPGPLPFPVPAQAWSAAPTRSYGKLPAQPPVANSLPAPRPVARSRVLAPAVAVPLKPAMPNPVMPVVYRAPGLQSLQFASVRVDRALPSTARPVSESSDPARFVSSTLKFAMAELGRTSPGARLATAMPTRAQSGARVALLRKPIKLALARDLMAPSADETTALQSGRIRVASMR